MRYARGRGVFQEKSGKEGGYRGSRSESTNTGPAGAWERLAETAARAGQAGEEEGGKGGQNGTKVDNLAQRWTKWHENGQNGRDGEDGTEIAIFRVKTFKSDLLMQADYCKAANYSYRPQTTQDCLTWVFGIKQDDEARKFRRLNYDTCNVS